MAWDEHAELVRQDAARLYGSPPPPATTAEAPYSHPLLPDPRDGVDDAGPNATQSGGGAELGVSDEAVRDVVQAEELMADCVTTAFEGRRTAQEVVSSIGAWRTASAEAAAVQQQANPHSELRARYEMPQAGATLRGARQYGIAGALCCWRLETLAACFVAYGHQSPPHCLYCGSNCLHRTDASPPTPCCSRAERESAKLEEQAAQAQAAKVC